uniref:Uncharacterized protein n=1 Tax=Arundo donax TaxID=35708 RepID=A0A0A9EHP4_ARUDO
MMCLMTGGKPLLKKEMCEFMCWFAVNSLPLMPPRGMQTKRDYF